MLLLYRQNSKHPAFIKIIRICKQEQVVRSRSKRTSGYRTFSLEGIELPVQEDFVSQIHNRELLERNSGGRKTTSTGGRADQRESLSNTMRKLG